MSDETQQRRGYGFWVVLALVLAPVVYVLSVGPAAYILERTGGTGEELAEVIYTPLLPLAESKWAGKRLRWYCDRWMEAARR
jgi:hypothetical protein